MLEKLTDQVNAMLNAMFGHIVDPEAILSVVDQSFQTALIDTRQQLAQAIATETQLELQVRKQPEAAELQLKLTEVSKLKSDLTQRLRDLEFELVKKRTKVNILNRGLGLSGPVEPIKLSSGAVLILLSFLVLWLLGALFMIVKHLS